MRMRTIMAVALTLTAITMGAPPSAAGGGPSLRTDEVCFTVHNDGDPQPSAVYGVRYSAGGPATTAIVLVHGVSPAHEYWDLRPDFSVARTLAAAGYTVFSYDRLGWGRSPYERPQGGHYLTLTAAQSMLHEIVQAVKAGSYTAPLGDHCPADGGPPAGVAIPTVIVMGASAGGAIVSGYPGRFHDVAAAIPVVFSNQGASLPFYDFYARGLVWGYSSGDDYYRVVPDEETCRKFVLYPPGVNPVFEPDFCRNGYGAAAPAGELGQFGRIIAENLVHITRVGPDLPVLLVFADHDALFPPDHPSAELNYWKAHCGCDVEGWTARDTGHGLVVHSSMPAFTAEVLRWLGAKGLTPTP